MVVCKWGVSFSRTSVKRVVLISICLTFPDPEEGKIPTYTCARICRRCYGIATFTVIGFTLPNCTSFAHFARVIHFSRWSETHLRVNKGPCTKPRLHKLSPMLWATKLQPCTALTSGSECYNPCAIWRPISIHTTMTRMSLMAVGGSCCCWAHSSLTLYGSRRIYILSHYIWEWLYDHEYTLDVKIAHI